MGARITQANVTAAAKKSCTPDLILKEAQTHKKALDDAVSSYRRKFFFNRKFQESEEASGKRLEAFNKDAKPALTTIYETYKAYKLDNPKIAKTKSVQTLQAIVVDVRKKLASLKTTLPGFDFDESGVEAVGAEETAPPLSQKVKECEAAKKKFDAAVKKFGSASFSSKTLTKGGDRLVALKEAAEVHIGCIYAAEQHYSNTVGHDKLVKIAESVRKTVHGIESDQKKPGELFDDDADVSRFKEYVRAIADHKDAEHRTIPAICFTEETLSYSESYNDFLTRAVDLYLAQLQKVREKKAKAKKKSNEGLNAGNNDQFYAVAKRAHKLLSDFKKIEPIIKSLIEKNPKYKVALKTALSKISNRKITSKIELYENQIKAITRAGKYGGDPGKRFERMDFTLDTFAQVTIMFISVFSDPKGSLSKYMKAIFDIKEQISKIEKVMEFTKHEQDYNISDEQIDKYIAELLQISDKLSKQIDEWDENFRDFEIAVSEYEREHSTAQKVIKVVKIVGFVMALAAGAAQISATASSSGISVSASAKKTT